MVAYNEVEILTLGTNPYSYPHVCSKTVYPIWQTITVGTPGDYTNTMQGVSSCQNNGPTPMFLRKISPNTGVAAILAGVQYECVAQCGTPNAAFPSVYVQNAYLNGENLCVVSCDATLQILTATSVCVAKSNCTGANTWKETAANSNLFTCSAAAAFTNTMVDQTLILVEDHPAATAYKIYQQSASCAQVW